MDKIIYFPTVALGAVLIVAYLYSCHRTETKVELPNIVNLVLGAGGIVGAGVLLVSCFSQDMLQKLADVKIYIFIAGLAVLYVSIQGVRKELVFKTREEKKSYTVEAKRETATTSSK